MIPRKIPRAWRTDDEDTRLRKLWSDPQLSVADVAKAMGRSKDSIKGRANTLQLPRKNAGRTRVLGESAPLPTRIDDSPHVELLMALGGFLAFSEEYLGNGQYAVRLPLVRAA